MTPEDLARHPVVAAALARHGRTPDDAIDSTEWRWSDSTPYFPGVLRGGPTVNVSRTDAHVSWEEDLTGEPRVELHIHRDATGWRHHVRARQSMPQSVSSALVGRRLDDLVVLEGGADLRILSADNDGGTVVVEVTPVRAATEMGGRTARGRRQA